MRTPIIAAVVLVVVIAGSLHISHTMAKIVGELENERDAARNEVASVRAELNKALEKIDSLTDELKAQNEKLVDLQNQAAAAAASSESSAIVDETLAALSDLLQDAPTMGPQTADAADEPPSDEQDQRSEDEQARRDRWREMVEQRRAEVSQYFADAIANTPDTQTRDRLAAIQEYRSYLHELGAAMRNATTDEEREQLRQDMFETARTTRQLVQEQRDSMVRSLAEEYGITNPKKQEAFVQSLDTLNDSPLFEGFGGGHRWPGGGRGSGRR